MLKSALTALAVCLCTLALSQKYIKRFSLIQEIKSKDKSVFISASDSYTTGQELWISNGTPEGTQLIKDINPGSYSSSPAEFTLFNGEVYFRAYHQEYQYELWKSDGTEAGTVMVADLVPSTYSSGSYPMLLTVFKNYLYFTTGNGKLYKTDGTTAGTTIVDQIAAGFSGRIMEVRVLGNYLYYMKTDKIERTDGTTKISIALPEKDSETYFKTLYQTDSRLYALYQSTYGTTGKLYVLDETTLTWTLLKKFTGAERGLALFTSAGERLFFNYRTNPSYPDSSTPSDELWVTDGTATGTVKLKSFAWTPYYSGSGMESFLAYNGSLYFRSSTYSSNVAALWKSDGTEAGTVKLSDASITLPNSGVPATQPSVVTADKFYFAGKQGEYTTAELWWSDGTSAGTQKYAAIDQGIAATPYLLSNANGIIYFATGNSYSGNVLWNTMPSPEINVSVGASVLSSNSSNLSFNTVLLDDCSKQSITIQNIGTQELALQQIMVTGTDFHLRGSLPEILDAAQKVTIDVFFHPSTPGKKQGLLTIRSNDTDEPEFSLPLAGETAASEAHGFCQAFDSQFTKIISAIPLVKNIALSSSTVSELSPAGTLVGMITMPASTATVTYALKEGKGSEDNNKFIIEGHQLKTTTSFNYESKNTYTIRIQATSGISTTEELFIIQVTRKPLAYTEGNCKDTFEALGYAINDVEFNAQGILFSIGSNGGIYRSANSGATWQAINSGIHRSLYKLLFNGSIGFIIGDGVLLRSEDNGSSWSTVYLPATPDYSSRYYLFFVDALNGYLSDSSGALFYTSDAGETWGIRKEKSSDGYRNIWFWDINNGMAFSGNSDLVKTSDGGKTWTLIPISTTEWYPTWTSLWFKNSNEGFMSNSSYVYRTLNGGTTWTKISDLTGNSIREIEFTSNQNGYIYGGEYSSSLLQTSDGGTTWKSQTNLPASGRISGMAYSTANNSLFAAQVNSFYYSSYSGRAISISTDNGTTWKELMSLQDENYSDIAFQTETTGFAFGEYNNYKTTDGGISWQKLKWNTRISSAYFVTSTTAFMVDGYKLYKTTDGGETFTTVITPADNYLLTKLYSFNGTIIFAHGEGHNGYYRSGNSGVTWQKINDPLLANMYYWNIHFVSALVGFRVDVSGSVHKTIDGGLTWSAMYTYVSGSSDYKSYHTLFFLDALTGFKAGNGISKTTDGGITWIPVLTKFNGEVWSLFFNDAMHGYASCRTQTLYETFDGGITWQTTTNLDENITDFKVKNGRLYLWGEEGLVGVIRPALFLPVQPGAISGNPIVCTEDTQLYNLAPIHDDTYQWSVPGAVVEDEGSSVRIHFPQAGEYELSVRLFNTCGVGKPRVMKVNAVALDTPILFGSQQVAAGSKNTNYTVVNAAPVNYNWLVTGADSFTNGNVAQTTVNWGNSLPEGEVSVIASDVKSGCRVRGDLPITIDLTVGLEAESNGTSVYPNPASDNVIIQTDLIYPLSLKVTDLPGREYYSQVLSSPQENIVPMNQLSPGLYLFQLHDPLQGKTIIKKVIKK